MSRIGDLEKYALRLGERMSEAEEVNMRLCSENGQLRSRVEELEAELDIEKKLHAAAGEQIETLAADVITIEKVSDSRWAEIAKWREFVGHMICEYGKITYTLDWYDVMEDRGLTLDKPE